jgi:hypothetical protein
MPAVVRCVSVRRQHSSVSHPEESCATFRRGLTTRPRAALAAASPSRSPLGTNGLRRRYRNRLHNRYPQNGNDLSPDQRVGIGAYRQLVLFARQPHCRQRSRASIHGPLGIAEPDAPFRRSIAHYCLPFPLRTGLTDLELSDQRPRQ